jgi:site-specific recombinase XerD
MNYASPFLNNIDSINIAPVSITSIADNLSKGKGSKERFVYIPIDMITDELETLRDERGDAWPVCSTRNNTIINRSNLWTIMTGIFRRAGVDQTGLHILRHTFARRLVNSNTNLKTISELLGHSDVSITAKFYAKTSSSLP